MSVILQAILAIFAAVGFYMTLHTVYELVFARVLRFQGTTELTLYGDGWHSASEQQLRTALYVRKHYLPNLSITFVELGSGQGINVAKELAARQDILYLE